MGNVSGGEVSGSTPLVATGSVIHGERLAGGGELQHIETDGSSLQRSPAHVAGTAPPVPPDVGGAPPLKLAANVAKEIGTKALSTPVAIVPVDVGVPKESGSAPPPAPVAIVPVDAPGNAPPLSAAPLVAGTIDADGVCGVAGADGGGVNSRNAFSSSVSCSFATASSFGTTSV